MKNIASVESRRINQMLLFSRTIDGQARTEPASPTLAALQAKIFKEEAIQAVRLLDVRDLQEKAEKLSKKGQFDAQLQSEIQHLKSLVKEGQQSLEQLEALVEKVIAAASEDEARRLVYEADSKILEILAPLPATTAQSEVSA